MSAHRAEVESLPADPRFNPAHPDHAGWANGAKPQLSSPEPVDEAQPDERERLTEAKPSKQSRKR
ncbi:MAG TPA: hypothetical protein VG674_30255 [Amycolatopsis sp.]|nr:hypothetical protein [Amycolatopsis sp.]